MSHKKPVDQNEVWVHLPIPIYHAEPGNILFWKQCKSRSAGFSEGGCSVCFFFAVKRMKEIFAYVLEFMLTFDKKYPQISNVVHIKGLVFCILAKVSINSRT